MTCASHVSPPLPTRYPTTPPPTLACSWSFQCSPSASAGPRRRRWIRQCKVTPMRREADLPRSMPTLFREGCMLRGCLGWDGGKQKQSPSRQGAQHWQTFAIHLKLRAPPWPFLWAGGARHQTTWQRTSDGRCPLVPGVPDAEHSSLRLPWSRRLSWRGRPGNKVEDSLPVNQRIRTHRAYYVQPRSAFARAPHLIHPKIQDQGQCGGGVPWPGVSTTAPLTPASWPA